MSVVKLILLLMADLNRAGVEVLFFYTKRADFRLAITLEYVDHP